MLNFGSFNQASWGVQVGAKIVDESMFTGVLAHPIRCRALTILADREASPVEIGRELGIGASHIAYHVRILLENGLIELTDETPRRGAIEHRYRAVSFAHSDEEFAELTAEERASFSRLIFCHAAADASWAFSAGTFARRHDHHISHLALQVDEDGWNELRDLYWTHLQEIARISREARERLAGEGMKGMPVLTFNTYFELPEERVAPRIPDWLPRS